MLTLKGKSVFSGISIGPLALFHRNTISTAVRPIDDAEAEVARLEECFADPQFHVKYAAQTRELTAQLDEAKRKVEELYTRWDELEEKNSGNGQ